MCEEKRIDFFVSFLTLIVLYSSSVDIWDLCGVDGAVLSMWERKRNNKRKRREEGQRKWRGDLENDLTSSRKSRCRELGWLVLSCSGQMLGCCWNS